jgi:hypothetical protein
LAELVVDSPEVVQVDDQNGDEVAVALGPQQDLLETVADERPVGEVGEGVVANAVTV